MEDTYGAVMVPKDELRLQLHPLHKKPFDIPDIGRVLQNLTKTREVGEFLSGALAGAMTKEILAPLETIRTRMVVGVGSKNISGSFVHARAVTGGFHGNVFVGSSLVDMYAKAKTVCAFLEELNDAVKVKFIEEQPEKLIESNPSFFSQFTLVNATQLGYNRVDSRDWNIHIVR